MSGAKDQLGELIWTLASRRHGSGSSAIRWQWDGGVHQGWLMAGTQALTCQSRGWRLNCLVSCCSHMGSRIGPEASLLVSPIHVPLKYLCCSYPGLQILCSLPQRAQVSWNQVFLGLILPDGTYCVPQA